MVISQFDHRSLVISICGGGSDCICDWPAIVFLLLRRLYFPGDEEEEEEGPAGAVR